MNLSRSHQWILITLTALLPLFLATPDRVSAQNVLPEFGGARSGTVGFQFVKIMVDPRSAAMGGSNSADAMDGASLYWNPALATQADKNELFLGHTSYFADISMEYASYIHHLDKISIAGSVQYLNSGEIMETSETQPFGTGRTFRTVHASAGLTVSQKLTELFSYGITARFITERIEEISYTTGGIDFGFFYRVGDTGARFSVAITNFGFDASPAGTTTNVLTGDDLEGTQDMSLPTTFSLGAAYDLIERDNMNLVTTVQVTNPSDNSERFSIGAEYGYMDQFFVRTGYQFGRDEVQLPSVGAGVKLDVSTISLHFDYSYSSFEILNNIHRLSLRFGF